MSNITTAQKLAKVKVFLAISDTTQDALLTAYLDMARDELINWRYALVKNSDLARAYSSNEDSYVSVDILAFIATLGSVTNGSYVFTYSEATESWQYESADVDLEDYGIDYRGAPEDEETVTVTYNDLVLVKYDYIEIMAVVIGYNLSGAEGQKSHSEIGVGRSFEYSNMIQYVHSNVPIFVGVIG